MSQQPSRTQLEMLVLRSSGMTLQEIGRETNYSRRNVKYHLDGLRRLLGARDLVHCVAIAVAAGLVLPDGRARRLFVPDEIPEYVAGPSNEAAGAGSPAT